MDKALLCLAVEEAYRAGIMNGLERCAVMQGHDERIGEQPLREVLAAVGAEVLDCYTITARSPALTRVMAQIYRES